MRASECPLPLRWRRRPRDISVAARDGCEQGTRVGGRGGRRGGKERLVYQKHRCGARDHDGGRATCLLLAATRGMPPARGVQDRRGSTMSPSSPRGHRQRALESTEGGSAPGRLQMRRLLRHNVRKVLSSSSAGSAKPVSGVRLAN